jgi:hypothetical protein
VHAGEADEGAEHEELVGERIEECPRTGRTLTARHVPVHPVGAGQHDPDHDEWPGGGTGDGHQCEEHRPRDQPPDRERVRRSGKCGRPEGLAHPARKLP